MNKKSLIILACLLAAPASSSAISVDHNHDGTVLHTHAIPKETLMAGTLCLGSLLCVALALRIIYKMVEDKKNRTRLAKMAATGSLIASVALFYTAKNVKL